MISKLISLRQGASPAQEPPSVESKRNAIWEVLRTIPEQDRLAVGREIFAASLPEDEWDLIPSFERRSEPPMNTWRMQNERMQFDIAPEAKVLDVGSGGWPFKRATHLADMFPNATTHRLEQLKRDERPFDVVDIHRLPYADQAFDFVFCSHVLEHLEDPGRAIRELQRVAPRGYVEVPTRLSDVMFNFTGMADHHRWHGLNLNGTLALTEWTDAERQDLGTNQFWKLAQASFHNGFQSFLERNWGYFFIGIIWESHLPFVVMSKNGVVLDRSSN